MGRWNTHESILLLYPIFLNKNQKSLKFLKNSEKLHFNPLRIENSNASGYLIMNF